MGPFHVPVVAVLKDRVRAACRLRDDLVKSARQRSPCVRRPRRDVLRWSGPARRRGHRPDDVIEVVAACTRSMTVSSANVCGEIPRANRYFEVG